MISAAVCLEGKMTSEYVHIHTVVFIVIALCWWLTLSQTGFCPLRHTGLNGHSVGLWRPTECEFCLWCDHHSSLSGKHSSSYNWHDIQPECVIFFFLIYRYAVYSSYWLLMSVAVSHEEHVFDPQLNKLKDNSPLNPLMCVACIYDQSFMFFCIYPSIYACFSALLLLCSQGLERRFIMVWRESPQDSHPNSWANRAAWLWCSGRPNQINRFCSVTDTH